MTLAALKRKLQIGDQLTMVRHDWYPNGKLIGVPRYIVASNSVSITLALNQAETRGSYLHWPKACDISVTEKGFTVALDNEKGLSGPVMEYIFVS